MIIKYSVDIHILDFEVTDENDVIQQWTLYLKSKTDWSLEKDIKETQPALELQMIKPKTTVRKNKVFSSTNKYQEQYLTRFYHFEWDNIFT